MEFLFFVYLYYILFNPLRKISNCYRFTLKIHYFMKLQAFNFSHLNSLKRFCIQNYLLWSFVGVSRAQALLEIIAIFARSRLWAPTVIFYWNLILAILWLFLRTSRISGDNVSFGKWGSFSLSNDKYQYYLISRHF